MLLYLMAILGFLFLGGSIWIWILRRSGQRFFASPEQRATEEGLRRTFGEDTKWGAPGGTENELHESGDHGGHSEAGDADSH